MGNQSNMSNVSTLITDTCSEQLGRTDAVSCSSGVVYTQSACREDLLSLQGCLPDRLGSREVYISTNDQEAVETQANNLLNNLDLLNPSPECWAAVQPFLCLYLFGLCDSCGAAYQPSLRNVYSSAQMCVQQSGLQQTDSLEHLDCHLCQSVHPSQVLHQPPVVNWLLWWCHHTHTHTQLHTGISSIITCRKW